MHGDAQGGSGAAATAVFIVGIIVIISPYSSDIPKHLTFSSAPQSSWEYHCLSHLQWLFQGRIFSQPQLHYVQRSHPPPFEPSTELRHSVFGGDAGNLWALGLTG